MDALKIGDRVFCGGFVSRHGTVVGLSAEVNEAPTMVRVQLDCGEKRTVPRALVGPAINESTVIELAVYANRRKQG